MAHKTDPRILFVDRFLTGRPNALRKEGFELFAAAQRLGLTAVIAGRDCQISEREIPKVAGDFDLVVISENYPDADGGWDWWDWSSIKTPKCFWAIDTHLVDYRQWIRNSNIGFVGYNNRQHLQNQRDVHGFWLPYGLSLDVYDNLLPTSKTDDVVFIGGLNKSRSKLLKKYGIKHRTAYGDEYIRSMQSAKICFNKSISTDLNAKYFEIVGSGSFLLTNYNRHFIDCFGLRGVVGKCFYRYDWDIGRKINYFLKHDDEREHIAFLMREHALLHHTFDDRLRTLVQHCGFPI